MIDSRIDLQSIQKQDLFKNLKKEEIDYIILHSEILDLRKDAVLFTAGEKASRFYILTKGGIRVFRKTDHSEEEMARFTSGDTIGDFDFARGAVYDANAEAAEDSQLIAFPAAGLTIDSLVNEEPHTACRIILNAIVMMTARIKSTNRLVLDNMSWVQDLHRRAYEDAGTGLWKQTLITDEIAGNLKEPAALIMIKPDRFKTLVDSNGHSAGDEAMIKIALILKNFTRIMGHGWALRFKSNETGLIFNNCGEEQAVSIAQSLAGDIAGIESVPLKTSHRGKTDYFHFSATISWTVFPADGEDWDNLFSGNYANLLDCWKSGGERIAHYSNAVKS